jgi:hypothetical protein
MVTYESSFLGFIFTCLENVTLFLITDDNTCSREAQVFFKSMSVTFRHFILAMIYMTLGFFYKVMHDVFSF